MSIKAASYNLFFHKAYPEVVELSSSRGLDLLCLQECYTDELKEKAGQLSLADAKTYAHNPPDKHPKPKLFATGSLLSGNIGLAIYYQPKRLKLIDISSFQLPLPWQERKGGRTMQVARFRHLETKNNFVVCNIHLSALWSQNRSRRRQAFAALEYLEDYRDQDPVIMLGDFNYPVSSKGLRKLMGVYGLSECGVNYKKRTHASKLVKGKFDRIFHSSEFKEINYSVLPFGASDHTPVMAEIDFRS